MIIAAAADIRATSMPPPACQPVALAFTADGRTLASAGVDGSIRLWGLAIPSDPYAMICALAERALTGEEWAQYLPDQDPRDICP